MSMKESSITAKCRDILSLTVNGYTLCQPDSHKFSVTKIFARVYQTASAHVVEHCFVSAPEMTLGSEDTHGRKHAWTLSSCS